MQVCEGINKASFYQLLRRCGSGEE